MPNTERMPNTESPTLRLCQELIRRPSVTPDDAGCQALLGQRLEAMGFQLTTLRRGEVDNLWAIRGDSGPVLCFAGHTDVVPVGDETQWRFPPFTATIEGERLYGRGAADMKGALAAMICACEDFITEHPQHRGRIAFLLTSDEEGPAVDGTVRVVDWLREQGLKPDWCLIGEPSSSQQLGDTVKVGRRGSLNGRLLIKGTQGHIAYPHLADNPIHRAAPALTELLAQQWDAGNEFFPATSFQISNISGGTGATNVIPGQVEVVFNFRYSSEVTAAALQSRVETLLGQHPLDFSIDWTLSGEPFFTPPGALVSAVSDSVKACTGIAPELSTSGGTSDGRFIAKLGGQVMELGTSNATIHKVDEFVSVNALEQLRDIYRDVLDRLLG